MTALAGIVVALRMYETHPRANAAGPVAEA